jgi:hypothetical protein
MLFLLVGEIMKNKNVMKYLKIAIVIIFFTSCRNNEIKNGDKKTIEVVTDFSGTDNIELPYCLKVDFETGNEYYQTNIDTFLVKHNLKRNNDKINNLFSAKTIDFVSEDENYFMHYPYDGKASSVGKIVVNNKITAVFYAYLFSSEKTQPRLEIQTFSEGKLIDKLIVASIFTSECSGFRDFCINKEFIIEIKDYYGCSEDEISQAEHTYDFKINKDGFFEKLDKPIKKQVNISNINPKYQGKFSATVETELTTSGMASISYSFSISNNTVRLNEASYHEPISCNGNYRAIENNNILELYYDGNEESCKTDSPNFRIKKEGNKFYMKGLGGEGTFNTWIAIEKNNTKN